MQVLEAGQVQDADVGVKVVAAEALVDVLVDPGEEQAVERLRQVVSVRCGSVCVEEDRANLRLDHLGLVREAILQRARIGAEEGRDDLQQLWVAHRGRVLRPMPVLVELDVAEVEDRREHLADRRDLALRQADVFERLLDALELGRVLFRQVLVPAAARGVAEVLEVAIADVEEVLLLLGGACDE